MQTTGFALNAMSAIAELIAIDVSIVFGALNAIRIFCPVPDLARGNTLASFKFA